MTEYLTVEFRYQGETASLKLYSKFTCVHGKDSGEGKSEFLAMIERRIRDGSLTIETTPNLSVVIANGASLDALLDLADRRIIIIDEAAMLWSNAIRRINNSHHVFLCISRSLPLRGEYPLKGIYEIKRTDNWFQFNQVSGMRVSKFCDRRAALVTESVENRSEHELFSVYRDNIISARGRDRIERVLRNQKGPTIVFEDLGNIGKAYSILKKRCEQNPELVFYDYLAFEELLFKSKLINGEESDSQIDRFDDISLEEYYEALLEEKTSGTEFSYDHGKPLSLPYLDKKNFEAIFNTETGKGIYDLLKMDISVYDQWEK